VSDDHEVRSPAGRADATCSCGWRGTRAETDAHMYEHYTVFVEGENEDGTLVSNWGVR
jgi:hypothetical protein